MKLVKITPGRYIVAISGGVDSAVLLHLLATNYGHSKAGYQFVVAHFDHGIRPESSQDRLFVAKLAKKYDLPYEYATGKLGPGTSEQTARAARYAFLESIRDEYGAKAIITAHHQDDLLETMILNLLRGTYRKGLSSLKSRPGLIRPMLGATKAEIIVFAKAHSLKWHEDKTNIDQSYLRNYVRHTLLPDMLSVDDDARQKLLNISNLSARLNREINQIVASLVEDKVKFSEHEARVPRNWLIMLPSNIGREVLIEILNRLRADLELNAKSINQVLLFAKTGRSGKRRELSNHASIQIQSGYVLVVAKT